MHRDVFAWMSLGEGGRHSDRANLRRIEARHLLKMFSKFKNLVELLPRKRCQAVLEGDVDGSGRFWRGLKRLEDGLGEHAEILPTRRDLLLK